MQQEIMLAFYFFGGTYTAARSDTSSKKDPRQYKQSLNEVGQQLRSEQSSTRSPAHNAMQDTGFAKDAFLHETEIVF